MFAFGKSNFRLSGQKLFLDFKNPFKILAEAEPRLWRGEAVIAQNPNSENWRRVQELNLLGITPTGFRNPRITVLPTLQTHFFILL